MRDLLVLIVVSFFGASFVVARTQLEVAGSEDFTWCVVIAAILFHKLLGIVVILVIDK